MNSGHHNRYEPKKEKREWVPETADLEVLDESMRASSFRTPSSPQLSYVRAGRGGCSKVGGGKPLLQTGEQYQHVVPSAKDDEKYDVRAVLAYHEREPLLYFNAQNNCDFITRAAYFEIDYNSGTKNRKEKDRGGFFEHTILVNSENKHMGVLRGAVESEERVELITIPRITVAQNYSL
jgi:hypothetical protein